MTISIGIGKDQNGWFQKFEDALCDLKMDGADISFRVIDIDSNRFLEEVENLQVILWNPSFMGLRLAGLFKEKMYFLEKILGKTVFPSYETIWHFESKIAENYLFNHGHIHTPKTYITFDYYDALKIIQQIDMPVVLKKSEGAASKNVRLIHDKRWLLDYAERVFCNQLWAEGRQNHSKFELLRHFATRKWFWYFIISKYYQSDFGMSVMYLQEFIPNNDADLRVTIIGNQFAYGLWRKNRPKDFRASGSGRIDYEHAVPEEVLRYCQNINVRYGFDTMAYDILFRGSSFLINEMSYNYVDHALYNAPGYYRLGRELEFVQEHAWPQSLWVKALYEKLTAQERAHARDLNGPAGSR